MEENLLQKALDEREKLRKEAIDAIAERARRGVGQYVLGTSPEIGQYGGRQIAGLAFGIGQPDPYLRPQIAQAPEQPKAPILERLGWIEERLNNSENITRKMFDELLDRLNKLETMVRG